MDISVQISGLNSLSTCRIIPRFSSSSRFRCSKNEPPRNGNESNGGERSSTDWDKAWKSFKKQSKKTFFSQFNMDKYVTWNPPRSDYPASEEIDPIKKAERSNLMLWTSPRFTLIGAIVIVSFLLLYTILAPVK
ncbi:hypothetical protein CARUB_v10018227mg [Capsella rubella]|uniref:Uncharacterized protein n=1 Tax=Capsella rubella TaxID=81985 RepID=R0FRU2_9BRAS|nr:uncharacterized protein LOC17886883 [Capsella rubella]EOA24936.1 hypothetical protein CARUB_v10018227mg [Capsella rubella]